MIAVRPLTELSTATKIRAGFALGDQGIIIYEGKKRERHVYNLNVLDLSMVKHLKTDKVLTGQEVLVLCYLTYLYTLRLVNTRTIRRLTTVDRDTVTAMKDSVFMSLDLVAYKIATLRCIVEELTPEQPREIERNFIACGLTAADALLFHMLYFNDDIVEFLQSLLTITDKCFNLSVDSIPQELDRNPTAIREFTKAARYNAYKIRFVANANRYDFADMENELVLRAIQAYYWVRPFLGVEHAINYAKRSTYNHAHNLREWYQAPERARAVNTGEGYDNTCQCLTPDIMVSDFREDEEKLIDYLDREKVYA